MIGENPEDLWTQRATVEKSVRHEGMSCYTGRCQPSKGQEYRFDSFLLWGNVGMGAICTGTSFQTTLLRRLYLCRVSLAG